MLAQVGFELDPVPYGTNSVPVTQDRWRQCLQDLAHIIHAHLQEALTLQDLAEQNSQSLKHVTLSSKSNKEDVTSSGKTHDTQLQK